MKLRVATYNIHKGVTVRGRPRVHDIKLALHSIDADIVFLQEVQDRNERLAARDPHFPKLTQIEFLSTGGYEHHAYGMNAIYPHGHHGNAILSRHPIGKFTNHDVSDHALEKRGMLHAVTGFGRHEVHLVCVHFGLLKRSRIRQANFLVDFVQQEIPRDAPLIVAGDFNDWQRRVDGVLRGGIGLAEVTDEQEMSLLARLFAWRPGRADSARVARTFPSIAPWLTLDRIYLRGFRVGGVRVPRGIEWARRSDHAPLIADLELR